MSRPIVRSIATACVASAVFGVGVALAQGPSPEAPVSSGPAVSAAPSSLHPSSSPGPILTEDFTSPSDEWWTGTEHGESTSFQLGSLRTTLSDGPRRTWQWMDLPGPLDAIRVEGRVTLDEGDGAGGVTCGPVGETGEWPWGGYNTDGQWLLGRLVEGHIRVDARGELPVVRDPDAPVGGALPVALRLDCTAAQAEAEARAVLWTKGIRVGEVSMSGIGPFGKAGFLAAIDTGPLTVLFDDLVVRDLSAEAGVVGITASSAVTAAQAIALPAVTGTAAVGRIELALSDTGRPDPFATDGRARELAVWIWYPAVVGSTGAAAPYLPPTWADLVNSAAIVSQDLNAVATSSIAGAPLDGHPPVVVLLPGLGQPVAAYSALAEDLASHGYAVVGINPTGSSLVVFPDGHVVAPTTLGGIDPALLDDIPAWYAEAARVADVWVADAAFVVDTLATSPPAIGALDLDHVAYLGHSMGGAAAFEACRRDAGCAAAVDLDGTLWTEVRHTGLTAPSLVLRHDRSGGCDGFCESASADFATVEAAGESQQYAVAGSQHLDFSDLGLLAGPHDTQLPVGPIEAKRMTLITRDLVRSFLDEHVRGGPQGPFADAVARYPELR